MARSDKLYTNPRSKAGDEPDKREAKKGDTKDIDGEEYESIGYMKKVGEPATWESDLSEKDRKGRVQPDEKVLDRPDGGHEFWRKKKKKEEVPTS